MAGFSQVHRPGKSLARDGFASSVGGYTSWKLGNVNLKLIPGLIPGILAGAFLGASLANMLIEDILRLVFVAMMIWIGVKYIRSPFTQQASP